MLRRIVLFVPLFTLAFASAASAQPLAPPPPPLYDVQIRYQIEANRNERVAQYYEMVRDLRKIGFVRDPDEDVPDTEPENTRYNRMSGTIAADHVPLLLKQRHVRAIRLQPSKAKLPGADEPVRVHLDLKAGLSADRQRTLVEQARLVSISLGFQEGVGYDNRHNTRLVGSIPVKNLDALLLGLRRQPQAWKLLSKTLLSDLRATRGGQRVLEDVVTDWYESKNGKKIVADTLAQWRATPAARELIRSLPADVTSDPKSTVLQEQLLIHLLRSAEAEDTLSRLLADVLSDPAAPELVDRLLRRIELQAGGTDLPVLFRGPATIRVIEVLPEMPLPAVRPIRKPLSAGLEKLGPELRELVSDEARAATPARLELIYALTPDTRNLRRLALDQELTVEGQVGPVVTVVTTFAKVRALAALHEIAAIRLPRLPQALPLVAPGEHKPLALNEAGVARLHAMGHRGKGIVVAILDADFRGWDALVTAKKLPKETRLLDLTRDRNPRLTPDPWLGDPQQLGVGTRYALTLAEVAPEVELMLIRIDPGCPYMIQNVARAINGDGYHSLSFEQRFLNLTMERAALDIRKGLLLEERREVYRNFDEDGEPAKRREEYRKKQAQYDQDEADYNGRVKLYYQLDHDYNDLKRVRVAVSSLVWEEGYPVDGSSPLTRWFDDRPFKAAIWFQAGGDARGQAWTGLFRDEEANGAMQFAKPETPLQKGQWSHEFDFVKWQPAAGPETLDLPADVLIRLTLQWREAHDPLYLRIGEDRYREPLAELHLVLVQQLDPTGKVRPSDDIQVIAESVGPPLRLYAQANSATYEQTLVVRVPKAGRYAVRIEGRAPFGVEPPGAAVLPSARLVGELKPRLFVQTLGAPAPGRVLLHTYWTEGGTLGMPADARQVLTVGAINDKRERTIYSSRGPAMSLDLLMKPDLLAYDDTDGVVYGSGQSASFAAGLAAVTMNGNAPVRHWMKTLGLEPGNVVRVPDKWPR